MQIDQCVPEPQLAQFVNGELEEAELNLVAKHVDQCEPCQDTVVALAEQSNTFVETLRTAGEHASPHENALKLGLKRMLVSLRSSLRHVSDNDQGDDPRGPSSIFALTGESQDGSQKSPPMLGPYEVEKQLGQGGMGHVYRATHTKLKRTVALKILPASRWANSSAVSRFEREMEAIGVLDHPNIVRASDAGEDRGMHYLVMEYIDGLDLSRLGNRLGPLPVAEASELARQCAIGLHHAHENGLVHRDIKPSNLMVAKSKRDDSEVTLKILDLGLALLGDEHLQAGHELTTVGTLMGTLDYMSPEQGIDSHSVDQRTDIYSLGATLFKLLTGRAPYADPQYGTLMKKMTALATKQAPSIGSVRTDLPEDLVAVVDRMLSRDPDDRFESAEEVAKALAPFCNGANVSKLLRRADSLEDPPERVTPRFPVTAILGDETTNRPPNQQPDELKPTKPSTVFPWHRVLIGLCFAAATGLAGILFYISTDYGELKIQSDDPNATITVSKAGEEVEKLQIKNGEKRLWLRVGTYELKVDGEASVSIEPPSVAVGRRQAHAARVILPAKQTIVRHFDPYDLVQERRSRLSKEAESLVARGELQEALRTYKTYEQVIGLDPVTTHARAKVLMKMGWHEEADRVLQRLGKSKNLNGLPQEEWLDYYSNQATCCIAIGEYQRAADTARKGLNSVGLTEPRLWFLFGDATERVAENSQYASEQEISERRNDALAAYRKTLQLDANHEQAKLKLQQLQDRIEKEKADAAVFAEQEAKLKELAKQMLQSTDEAAKLDDEFWTLLSEVRESPWRDLSDTIIKPRLTVQIVVLGAPPNRPIAGLFQVEADGFVNLGPGYGRVDINKLTTNEAACVIKDHLQEYLVDPQVAVTLPYLSSESKPANIPAEPKTQPTDVTEVDSSGQLETVVAGEVDFGDRELEVDGAAQAQLAEEQAQALIEEAESLFEAGKLKEALEKYNDFLAANPATYRAVYGKAKVFKKLGWLDNNYAQLQQASAFADRFTGAEMQSFAIEFATAARENSDHNTAIAIISNVLNNDGQTNAELWYQLGICQKDFLWSEQYASPKDHRDQVEQALKSFTRAVQLDPEHRDAKSAIDELKRWQKSIAAEDSNDATVESSARAALESSPSMLDEVRASSAQTSDGKLTDGTPVYKGHDYNYWLKSLRTDRDPEIQKNAIEALGLLGEGRSLQAARAILEAMRTQAGSRVLGSNVIQALASLDLGMVIQAIRDEIKSGNHRSRQQVENLLGHMKPQSPDVTRLMEKIEEHSTELTKLRLENPRREERELKSNFFRLMLSKYSADPKLLRDQIADYHEELVLSSSATVELVKRAPDVPETWGLLQSRFPAERYHLIVNELVADIEVEKLQHMGPRLTEILRSVEKPSDYGKFEAIISTLGKLEEHGKEAIPVLIKVAEAEGARDQAWGGYACIALAGIQKTVQDDELEQTLRKLRKTWGPNGELNRAEWQKELRRRVIEAIDDATKAEVK